MTDDFFRLWPTDLAEFEIRAKHALAQQDCICCKEMQSDYKREHFLCNEPFLLGFSCVNKMYSLLS